jgi:phenol 2-monooxygenase (NADPH)
MENIRDTAYDFTLVLRQMYTEEILRQKLEAVGASYYQAVECTDFAVDEEAARDGHAVTATFRDKKTQKILQLKR